MRKYDYSTEVAYTDQEINFPLYIPRRYDVEDVPLTELFDKYDWQITYKFTRSIRGNHFAGGKYGADSMTFRRLYVILCEGFNNGKYFIEEYLKNQYPYREVRRQADKFLLAVNQEIMAEYFGIMQQARFTKNNKLDKRYKRTFRKLSQYSVLADSRVKEAGEILSEMVKNDIIACLSTGILMLDKEALAEDTVDRRIKLGLPPDTIFFASGQLIRNIQIYFRLEKKEWLSQYF